MTREPALSNCRKCGKQPARYYVVRENAHFFYCSCGNGTIGSPSIEEAGALWNAEQPAKLTEKLNWKVHESIEVDEWENTDTHHYGFMYDSEGKKHLVASINKESIKKLNL